MESRITISFDYDAKEPFIKIHHKHSDDERDRMIKAFLELMSGEVCFTKFKYEFYEGGKEIVASIRPIHFNNLKEEIKTMKVWVDHVEDNLLEERQWQYVSDNSTKFHEWLTEQGVAFAPAGHDTGISRKVNLFNLGVGWGKYKEQNQPK